MALKKQSTKENAQSQIFNSGLNLKKEAQILIKENMVQKNIRLTQSDWSYLESLFHKKGLSLSSGLRMVLRQYIEDSQ